MKTKLCKKCGSIKPLSEMVKGHTYKGRQYFNNKCKDCRNINNSLTRPSRRKQRDKKICSCCGISFIPSQPKCIHCSDGCRLIAKKAYRKRPDVRLSDVKYSIEYQKKHPDKKREWDKKYREKHRDKKNAYDREMRQKNINDLSDSYIKKLFRWGNNYRLKDVPQSLIELKRKQLKLKRYGKQDNESR